MTYGKLKQRILSLLDLKTETGVINGSVYDAVISSMAGAVDSAARKIAVSLKNVVKSVFAVFSEDGESVASPSDMIALKSVVIDGKVYAPTCFFISDGNIVGRGVPSGEAQIYYYAYPTSVVGMTDSTETDFDGMFFDLVAAGAALELCSEAYPGDVGRYSVLAGEYDGKMACAFIAGGDCTVVGNSLYGKRRLV